MARLEVPAGADSATKVLATKPLLPADRLEVVGAPVKVKGPFQTPLAPGEKVLFFGGSFGPPTAEHMGILVRLMERYGFTRALMMPTVPYKKDAPPAELSLRWCRTAVENISEILQENAFGSQPRALGPGHAAWLGADGIARELVVSDYEITNDIRGDTLATLRATNELLPGAAPEDIYVISGADSFQSIPTWTGGSDAWQELLDKCNWLAVSRPGSEDKVDPTRRNPLAACLPAEVIERYRYSTDQNGIHRYARDNGPGMAVVSNPTRDFSTSKVKSSLKEDGDHDNAEQMLQPSVFHDVAKSEFFGDFDKVFTERNFANYLRARFTTLAGEVAHDPAFQEALEGLIAKLEPHIAAPKASMARRMLTSLVEHSLEAVNPKALAAAIKNASKSDVGLLPAAMAIGEVLEWVLRPVAAGIAYLVGGTKAATAVGFANLAKFLGSRARYRELESYAHKLSRGDAKRTVATLGLESPFTLGGGAMAVNLVKSQMFKWVPLPIRRLADARVTWYDMNLSVNELRAILANPRLDGDIRDSVGPRNQALYAHALLAAIQQVPAAQVRLELFAGQRYFKRLSFGDEPDTHPPTPMSREVIDGFTPTEQRFIRNAQGIADDVRGNLSPTDRPALERLITAAYLIVRTAQTTPERLRDPTFWDNFVDISLTGYPAKQTDADRGMVDRWLVQVLDLVETLDPALLAGATPTFRGTPPVRHQAASAPTDRSISRCAARYFELTGPFMRLSAAANSDPEKPTNIANLSWRIEQARAVNAHRHAALGASFDRRLDEFGEIRDVPRKSRQVLRDAKKAVDAETTALDWQYRELQFAWLAEKKALPKGVPVDDPAAYEQAFATLESRARDLADRLSRITMTLAVDGVDLDSPSALQNYVEMLRTMGSSYRPTTMRGNILSGA